MPPMPKWKSHGPGNIIIIFIIDHHIRSHLGPFFQDSTGLYSSQDICYRGGEGEETDGFKPKGEEGLEE